MKSLIIYAHPNTEGHCPYILEKLSKNLDEKKENYEVLDLYKMNYDPVLHENEHYTSGNKEISKENLEIQEKIKNTNTLYLIFPTWWNGVPAILKGFFDKILTAPFAYSFKKGGFPVGHLKHIKAKVFITHGAPFIGNFIMEGNRLEKVIKKDVLKFCGINSKVFHVFNASKLNDKKKKSINKKVNRATR